MDTIFLQLLGTGSSDGVGQDEGAALGQTRGGDLHDLGAVHLAQDALLDHLLRQVAVLHEAGVLLQEVGKLVRAEGDAALVGGAVVAQLLLSLQEQLIGVALGSSSRIGVVVGRGRRGQSLKDVGIILRYNDLTQLPGNRFSGVQSICYPTGSLSGSSYGFP